MRGGVFNPEDLMLSLPQVASVDESVVVSKETRNQKRYNSKKYQQSTYPTHTSPAIEHSCLQKNQNSFHESCNILHSNKMHHKPFINISLIRLNKSNHNKATVNTILLAQIPDICVRFSQIVSKCRLRKLGTTMIVFCVCHQLDQ